MMLNKKYFLAVFTAIVIQTVLGINLANAICDNEIKVFCSIDSYHQFCDHRRDETVAEFIQQFLNERKDYPTAEDQKRQRREEAAERYRIAYQINKPLAKAYSDATMCILEHTLSLNQSGTSGQQSSNKNSSSNQSSNSGTQSNSNQQANNSQSNQSNNSNNSNASSQNQISQQNISSEDVERNNARNYYAQKTAVYEQKYQGRGKKHNLDADANRCIKTKGRKVLNICDYDVEAVFCAVNPDQDSVNAFEHGSAFDCAKNRIGMWPISGGKAMSGVFTAESVSVFACKRPSHPSGAVYDHQKQAIVARCSEY